tara:strand:- start:458 stop:754 length:297 start_codon:yes stop_codon:yes gene_type:complete
MRSAICDDGKRRILAKVEVPVGATDITYYALAHPEILNNDNPENKLAQLNKRQIFLLAKETLRRWGTEEPFELVVQNYKRECINKLEKHVTSLFPEID